MTIRNNVVKTTSGKHTNVRVSEGSFFISSSPQTSLPRLKGGGRVVENRRNDEDDNKAVWCVCASHFARRVVISRRKQHRVKKVEEQNGDTVRR